MVGTAVVVTGVVLAPVVIKGAALALGFCKDGIVANSNAAWMMSLYNGNVTSNSIVAILQSAGATSLSIETMIAASSVFGISAWYIAKEMLNTLDSKKVAVDNSMLAMLQSVGAVGLGIAASYGSGVFGGNISKSMQNTLDSKKAELKELENFVSINESDDGINEKNILNKKVIFDMKQQLLDIDENEKLKSFLKGFEVARDDSKDRAKKFEFLVIRDYERFYKGSNILRKLVFFFDKDREKLFRGSNFLHQYLIDTHGNDHVTLENRSIFLNLNNP
ncbi:9688_t:CDS:1 [Funneliformis geosporum]|uniref:19568_t:CDS:1 n=1 Tax=Funneliformis geosporum TaxID=1117311 RepID=A0A9W4WRB9_9GLOM|nr:9688_t:CDS:1 [Funneliformis geosporum]CAI2173129.1 19568_t:CDS:1 [Funneliformis geosporum]